MKPQSLEDKRAKTVNNQQRERIYRTTTESKNESSLTKAPIDQFSTTLLASNFFLQRQAKSNNRAHLKNNMTLQQASL